MNICIASGKGGTGKTTISTNLALSIQTKVQLLDCDVEEPNSHLFITPEKTQTEIINTPVPKVDEDKCNLCGKCGDICQFKAISVMGSVILTFPELCHSCGGCLEVCPEGAISETNRELGSITRGFFDEIECIYGTLRIGEAMSPPLIKKVRSLKDPDKITIIDAPPGTSCPVIASMKDSDFVLLVTEPTPFGLHDLKLAVETVKILKLPAGLVINRSDIGFDKVVTYAKQENIPILMEIPFDINIAKAYSKGIPFVNVLPEYKEKFLHLFESIKSIINKNGVSK